MKKISVNHVTLAYERMGQGKPLMLIHGFPLDHSIWNETAELLKEDFDVILPDLRGFGQSSSVDSSYTMNDMADDLAGLMDALGVEKVALAGHSMGGYVALACAAKYPERMGGLSLVASQTLADAPEKKEGRYKTALQVEEGGSGVVAGMAEKFSRNEKIQSTARDVILRQNKSGVMGALKAMAEREDTTSTLASVDFPLVLIHGDADELISVERARELKQSFSQAHLVELAGVGHAPMMDAPGETAQALHLLK